MKPDNWGNQGKKQKKKDTYLTLYILLVIGLDRKRRISLENTTNKEVQLQKHIFMSDQGFKRYQLKVILTHCSPWTFVCIQLWLRITSEFPVTMSAFMPNNKMKSSRWHYQDTYLVFASSMFWEGPAISVQFEREIFYWIYLEKIFERSSENIQILYLKACDFFMINIILST